jgi:subtilisin family serine protease
LVTGRPSRIDTVDHGTAVASLIAARRDGQGIDGVAPAARVMPVRIFNGYSAPRPRLIRAIRWVADQHVDVLNLSLTERPCPALHAAVNYALSRGVIIVAGSGNDGTNTADGAKETYPAAYPGVIAVGAVRRDLTRADFSNAGDFVDVVAPGKHVLAADPGNTLSWYDGTSFSTPHVSGVVALMLAENPHLSRARVTRILRTTARDLGPRGRDHEYGWGLVDARAAVKVAAHTH